MADGLHEHLVAVEAEDTQRLRVRFQCAGADAEQEPSLEQVVQHRRLGCDQDGVVWERLVVPVPSLICRVSEMRLAWNSMEFVMLSAASVTCSPT